MDFLFIIICMAILTECNQIIHDFYNGSKKKNTKK